LTSDKIVIDRRAHRRDKNDLYHISVVFILPLQYKQCILNTTKIIMKSTAVNDVYNPGSVGLQVRGIGHNLMDELYLNAMISIIVYE